MNFLQLAQRLRREMNDVGEGPQSVINQTGRSLDYVEAISQAWVDIQQLRQWNASFWSEDFSPRNLQLLSENTDTPFIDPAFHLAIVFYAMQSEAISQNAQELVLLAQQEWDKYLHLLCSAFLPIPSLGR